MVRLDICVFISLELCICQLQCIPHVLAMSTDRDTDIRSMAELQLTYVNKQHPIFIQVRSSGLSCCFVR